MTDLDSIDRYLDVVPRSASRALDVGGAFTLFVGTGPSTYYARPRRRRDRPIGAVDLDLLRTACAANAVPLCIEWVDELTPSLAGAAHESGLEVVCRPLLAMAPGGAPPRPGAATLLDVEDSRLATARAVAELSFSDPGTAVGTVGEKERDASAAQLPTATLTDLRRRTRAGLVVTAVVENDHGIVAVGQHQPLGAISEIVGVATLPFARRRGWAGQIIHALIDHARASGVGTVFLTADSDEVARIYERAGFERIGTSCEATPPMT